MKIVVLTFLTLINLCSSFRIRCLLYYTSYEIINTTNTDLNQNDVPDNVSALFLEEYYNGEEQLDSISDLSKLRDVEIRNQGQEFVPSFRNVPYLFEVLITGNPISFITKDALSHTTVENIILNNNNISVIEPKSFGPVKLLVLACNKLSTFQSRWFKNPSKLEELDMSGNEIISIPEYAFKNFINLQEINLNYNKITTIGHGAFSDCFNLYMFKIGNNELLELSSDVFPQMRMKFDAFHVQNNRLTYLPKDLMKRISTSFGQVRGNPWQCSCWDLIRQWNNGKLIGYISLNTVPHKELEEESECVDPENFQDICIESVDFDLIEHYEKNINKQDEKGPHCERYDYYRNMNTYKHYIYETCEQYMENACRGIFSYSTVR